MNNWEILAIVIGALGFVAFLVIIVMVLGGWNKLKRIFKTKSFDFPDEYGYKKPPTGKKFYIMDGSKRIEIGKFRDINTSERELYDINNKKIKKIDIWQMQLSEKTIRDLSEFETVNHYYFVIDEGSANNHYKYELKVAKIDIFKLEQERLRLLARTGEYNNELAKQKGKEYKSEYGDRKIVVVKNGSKKYEDANNVEVE